METVRNLNVKVGGEEKCKIEGIQKEKIEVLQQAFQSSLITCIKVLLSNQK